MKFIIEYTIRNSGLRYDENLANGEALLTAFGKWKPDEGLKIHAFVTTLAAGGYVLVEADDLKSVASLTSKFTSWNDVKVVPVFDVSESMPIAVASLAWARSAAKG
jgi:hypothetical protein